MKPQSGVVVGVVTSLEDPRGEGRVQIDFPWLGDLSERPWAPVAAPFAGGNRGAFYHPEVDDEVLVAFEHGDFNHPFIIGYLWSGRDRPPSDDPRRRLFKSVNGHSIEIYDAPVAGGDQGYIRIQDAHGNVIELANARITIRSVAAIQIEAPSVTINGRPVAPVGPPI